MMYEVEIFEMNHYTLKIEAESEDVAEEIAIQGYTELSPDDMYIDEIVVSKINEIDPLNLTQDQLKLLRNEIVLGSLYVHHYENSFGIPAKNCCDFFDGFTEYCWELAEELAEENHMKLSSSNDVYDKFDNIETLWDYYNRLEFPFK